MAFKASAPPMSAYQTLADSHHEGKVAEAKPSSSAYVSPDAPHQSTNPHHHHHHLDRFASDPSHQHHPYVAPPDPHQVGFVTNPLPIHPTGSIQYPSTTSTPDANVVFGFPVQPQYSHPRWHTSLCACCSDPGVCALGCCCPCYLFGKIAEHVDNGSTSCLAAATIWYVLQQFTLCGWLYSYGYRDKLRATYGIRRRPGCDCIVHCCCWSCAFCQEYREIQIRRHRSEAAWGRSTVMAPPPQQVMRY